MKPRPTTPNQPADGELLRCQESIGYLFRRNGLLRKALTHSSVKDESHPSNERLEFLGDAILGMVISEYLFSLLPENDEGDLTKVKSVVVSSHTLSRLGLEMGIHRYLLLGKGIRLKKEIPRSLVANAVEAVIAAVYLDRGMEAARHFILDHLHPYVEEVLTDRHEEKNYKSLLQQRAQKELSGTPIYRVVDEQGPDHSKRFRVEAVVNGHEFPMGTGASKKEAEQEAARIALAALDGDRGRRKSRKKVRRGSNGEAPRAEPVAKEKGRTRSVKTPAKKSRRKSEEVAKPRKPEAKGREGKPKKKASRKPASRSAKKPARKAPLKPVKEVDRSKKKSKGNGRRRRSRAAGSGSK